MDREQSINQEETTQKQNCEYLSKELLQLKQLKTTNMFGGKGGFGFVMFVEEVQNSSNKYAVKAQSILDQNIEQQVDKNLLKICKKEAEILRNCKHKNIVEFHSDYEIGFFHIIQMNLCECSFEDWIEQNKQFSINDSVFLNITNQILDGLEYFHDQGYILRDLSVRNILLTKEGIIKLCDFGSAKKYDETFLSQSLCTQSINGVFFYFPPEVLDDITNNIELKKQTKKGDIWALGVCLFLIGGAQITQYPLCNASFKLPNSPNISEKANKLIEFILNKNPFERPTIEQIRKKICDLFLQDQNQETQIENIYNLKFDYKISNSKQEDIFEQNNYKKLVELFKIFCESDGNSQDFEKLVQQINQKNIKPSFEIAQQYYKNNEKYKSLEMYYELIQIDESNYQYYKQIGQIESELGCHKNSIGAYKKAIQINKTDYLIQMALAFECIEDKQFKIAIETLTQLIQLIQQTKQDNFQKLHSNCYLLLGKAEYGRMHYSEALNYILLCLQNQNDENYYEAQIINLKCQIRIQKKCLFGFKQQLLHEFFSYLYLLHNSDSDNQQKIKEEIEQKFLSKKEFIDKRDMFIMAEALYDFDHQDLSTKFFFELINIDPQNDQIYYYLGQMENDIDIKSAYFIEYIKVFQRDDRIFRYFAEQSPDTKQKIYYYENLISILSNDIELIEKMFKLYETENQQHKLLNILFNIFKMNKNNTELKQQIQDKIIQNLDDKFQILFYKIIFYFNPKYIIALEKIIQIYKRKNIKSQYLKYLDDLMIIDQNNKYGITLLIINIVSNDYDNKQEQIYFQNYIQDFKSAVVLIQNVLNEYQKSFNVQQRIKCYELIIKIEPKNFEILCQLFKINYDNSMFVESKKYLQLMEEIQPNNEYMIKNSANLYHYHLKDIDKAISYYYKQLQFQRDLKFYQFIGDLCFQEKQFLKSKEIYQECLEFEKDQGHYLFKLAQVEYELKNYSKSNEIYRKAEEYFNEAYSLKTRKLEYDIQYNMGMNHYLNKDDKKSLKRFKNCIDKFIEGNAQAYYMIGKILLKKQNEKENSIDPFRKAIKKDISLQNAYYYLGIAYRDLNYVWEAVAQFKKFLQFNSEGKKSKYCNDYIKENELAEIKTYQKKKFWIF